MRSIGEEDYLTEKNKADLSRLETVLKIKEQEFTENKSWMTPQQMGILGQLITTGLALEQNNNDIDYCQKNLADLAGKPKSSRKT